MFAQLICVVPLFDRRHSFGCSAEYVCACLKMSDRRSLSRWLISWSIDSSGDKNGRMVNDTCASVDWVKWSEVRCGACCQGVKQKTRQYISVLLIEFIKRCLALYTSADDINGYPFGGHVFTVGRGSQTASERGRDRHRTRENKRNEPNHSSQRVHTRGDAAAGQVTIARSSSSSVVEQVLRCAVVPRLWIWIVNVRAAVSEIQRFVKGIDGKGKAID